MQEEMVKWPPDFIERLKAPAQHQLYLSLLPFTHARSESNKDDSRKLQPLTAVAASGACCPSGMMFGLLFRTRSFLLNNLLTFTTSYLTINPVVRCVPPVSLGTPSTQGKKNDFGRRAFASVAPQIWNHSLYLPQLKYLDHLTPSLQNTLFYLAIISSPPSDSPTPLIKLFFNFGALPNILHYITNTYIQEGVVAGHSGQFTPGGWLPVNCQL